MGEKLTKAQLAMLGRLASGPLSHTEACHRSLNALCAKGLAACDSHGGGTVRVGVQFRATYEITPAGLAALSEKGRE